jgi:hypothetical protein
MNETALGKKTGGEVVGFLNDKIYNLTPLSLTFEGMAKCRLRSK